MRESSGATGFLMGVRTNSRDSATCDSTKKPQIQSNYSGFALSSGIEYLKNNFFNLSAQISGIDQPSVTQKWEESDTQVKPVNTSNFDAEEEFFDCFQEPIGLTVLRKNKTDIKRIVAEQLRELAAKPSADNRDKNSYLHDIKKINRKVCDDVDRIKDAMLVAQNKHKKYMAIRNKEVNERTTKALIISCAVIAACLLPVAGIPLLAAFALGGIATAAVFAGITLFSQLGGWVLRKSVLEPNLFGKLKDKLNHNHVCMQTEQGIRKSKKCAFKAVDDYFLQRQTDFLQEYDAFIPSLKTLSDATFNDEFKKELEALDDKELEKILNHGISNSRLQQIVKTALDKSLQHEQAKRDEFIKDLKTKTDLSHLYPEDVLKAEDVDDVKVTAFETVSATSSEAFSTISKGGETLYFEKQLWAKYVLKHHIGEVCKLSWLQRVLHTLTGRKFTTPGVLESSIVNRLNELNVIETQSQKNWFRSPQLTQEEVQAVRKWAEELSQSFDSTLSIFNISVFDDLSSKLSASQII
jgi:hypothetical protein